jgi:hypothetical protein
VPGKRVEIDDETWASIKLLAKDSMTTFQELFDEAMRDLLKKHGIPRSLKEAFEQKRGAARSKRTQQRKARPNGPKSFSTI